MRIFLKFAFLIFLAERAISLAQAAPEFLVTKEELSMMPPYCTALYGKYHGEPPPQDHPLRDTIPACPSVHHYCDALKSIIRADRSWRDKYLVTGELQQVDQSLRSVIEEWKQAAPNCALYPEAYTNLGKTIVRRSRYGLANAADAVSSFESAIRKNPNYEPAYLGLADLFIQFNNKNDALAALERGLQQVPNSRMLAKRYQKLGGKPETLQSNAPSPDQNVIDPVPEQEPAARQEPKPAPPATKQEPASQKVQETQKIGSPTNPWCRFCTDDIDQPEEKK